MFDRVLNTLLKTMNMLKSDSHLPKKNYFIYFNESPLKMTKNAFYLILKALFVLKIIQIFVFTFWSYRKNGFIRNQVNSKVFDVTTWLTNKYILPSISQSEGNQTMKLDRYQNIIREIFFFKYHAENEAGKLAYNKSRLHLTYNKNKLYRTLEY